uniref:Uncharacterized protein n=1 Tax=Chromera velia CCMP2878 TaxID=1169474 RepID=A0A0G4HBG0_9ALVE|eukprot:Cvel_25978.t1-p1 / transcript=Cvel_25978.t1 / gene=Cvel_25978 / organism=Chromera_velia_CCMP2878 / gene_product=hypothetical protein / transcript_product=hypothetical protein / location=Cvel_scaffold3017:3101-3649(-) / protein_length=183 / sequence_SO=supercontig / SO=protein_coding / is_pseudo=false
MAYYGAAPAVQYPTYTYAYGDASQLQGGQTYASQYAGYSYPQTQYPAAVQQPYTYAQPVYQQTAPQTRSVSGETSQPQAPPFWDRTFWREQTPNHLPFESERSPLASHWFREDYKDNFSRPLRQQLRELEPPLVEEEERVLPWKERQYRRFVRLLENPRSDYILYTTPLLWMAYLGYYFYRGE